MLDKIFFSTFEEYSNCEIIAIPSKYDFKPYAYGFQKNSPYLKMFNFFLKSMIEKGALKQILNKYEARPQVCPDLNGLPLGFDSCFTAFLALLAGLAGGILLILVEVASKWSGKNWYILEAYDRRGDDYIDDDYRNEVEQKDFTIQSLSLQVKLLERKLYKLEQREQRSQQFDYAFSAAPIGIKEFENKWHQNY